MINSRKLQITGLSMLSLVGSGCTDKNGSIENGVRPNIVLFLADDIGAECFGCMGGVSYDTHIIDSLAEKSLFFPNMHAQPLSWCIYNNLSQKENTSSRILNSRFPMLEK